MTHYATDTETNTAASVAGKTSQYFSEDRGDVLAFTE